MPGLAGHTGICHRCGFQLSTAPYDDALLKILLLAPHALAGGAMVYVSA